MNIVEQPSLALEEQAEKNAIAVETHTRLEKLAQSIVNPDAQTFLKTMLVYNNPRNPNNAIGKNRQHDQEVQS